MYKTMLLSWIGSSTLIVRMFLYIKLKAPVMDWQFYTYCQNVSMYKTSLLSLIGSSTRIVGMFLCIKLGSCHELAVLHVL